MKRGRMTMDGDYHLKETTKRRGKKKKQKKPTNRIGKKESSSGW